MNQQNIKIYGREISAEELRIILEEALSAENVARDCDADGSEFNILL